MMIDAIIEGDCLAKDLSTIKTISLIMTRPKGAPLSESGKKRSDALKLAYAEGRRTSVFTKNNEYCKNYAGKEHTEEWKKERSAAMKAKNPMLNPDVAKRVSETRIRSGVCAGKNNPNWAGGSPSYRGIDYDRQRAVVLNRDNYQCRECGIKQEEIDRQLDVHHIIPYKDGGTNRLDNLITVCRRCHNLIEPRGFINGHSN